MRIGLALRKKTQRESGRTKTLYRYKSDSQRHRRKTGHLSSGVGKSCSALTRLAERPTRTRAEALCVARAPARAPMGVDVRLPRRRNHAEVAGYLDLLFTRH